MNNHPGGNGMTGKPGSQSGPSDAVLHAVKKVQEEAQRQSNQQSPGQTRFVTPVQMNQGNNMGQMVSGQQINPAGTINSPLPQGGNMNTAQQQGTNTIMVQGQGHGQGNWSQPTRFSGPGGHITNQSPQPGMQTRMGAPQMQPSGQGGQQPKPTRQSLDQLLLALKSPNSEEQVRLQLLIHVISSVVSTSILSSFINENVYFLSLATTSTYHSQV